MMSVPFSILMDVRVPLDRVAFVAFDIFNEANGLGVVVTKRLVHTIRRNEISKSSFSGTTVVVTVLEVDVDVTVVDVTVVFRCRFSWYRWVGLGVGAVVFLGKVSFSIAVSLVWLPTEMFGLGKVGPAGQSRGYCRVPEIVTLMTVSFSLGRKTIIRIRSGSFRIAVVILSGESCEPSLTVSKGVSTSVRFTYRAWTVFSSVS
mmetsp:Transcript_36826/g.96473  ORF Transcript_36826/g.96473 Transcript_36826/m.96473 type:complete len:203 (+) Transcript_36826:274-882(+)